MITKSLIEIWESSIGLFFIKSKSGTIDNYLIFNETIAKINHIFTCVDSKCEEFCKKRNLWYKGELSKYKNDSYYISPFSNTVEYSEILKEYFGDDEVIFFHPETFLKLSNEVLISNCQFSNIAKEPFNLFIDKIKKAINEFKQNEINILPAPSTKYVPDSIDKIRVKGWQDVYNYLKCSGDINAARKVASAFNLAPLH